MLCWCGKMYSCVVYIVQCILYSVHCMLYRCMDVNKLIYLKVNYNLCNHRRISFSKFPTFFSFHNFVLFHFLCNSFDGIHSALTSFFWKKKNKKKFNAEMPLRCWFICICETNTFELKYYLSFLSLDVVFRVGGWFRRCSRRFFLLIISH